MSSLVKPQYHSMDKNNKKYKKHHVEHVIISKKDKNDRNKKSSRYSWSSIVYFIAWIYIIVIGICIPNSHDRMIYDPLPPVGWEHSVIPFDGTKKGQQPTVIVTRLPDVSSLVLDPRLAYLQEQLDRIEDLDGVRQCAMRILDKNDLVRRPTSRKTNDGIRKARTIVDKLFKLKAPGAARVHTGANGGLEVGMDLGRMALFTVVTEDGKAPLFPVVSDMGADDNNNNNNEKQMVAQLAIAAHSLGKAIVKDTMTTFGPHAATWMERKLRSVPVNVIGDMFDVFGAEKFFSVDHNTEAAHVRQRHRATEQTSSFIVLRAGKRSASHVYGSLVHEIIHEMWYSFFDMIKYDVPLDEKNSYIKMLMSLLQTEMNAGRVLRRAGLGFGSTKEPYALHTYNNGRREETLPFHKRLHEVPPEAITARTGINPRYLDVDVEKDDHRARIYKALAHRVGSWFEYVWAPHLTATIRAQARAFSRYEMRKKEKQRETNIVQIVDRVPNVLEYVVAPKAENAIFQFALEVAQKAIDDLNNNKS
jgi:hypothetical protein